VPFQVPSSGRPHPRLTIVVAPEPAAPRIALVARALLARLWLVWLGFLAVLGALAALLPLAWRRAPLGRRLHPPRREARVIQLPPARRAAPR
jgi:hypothetical protein